MPGPGGRAQKQRQSGFTLIELLVVMAIAAMLIAIVPTSLGKLREVSQYRDTVRSVVLSLRQARQDAVESGRVTVFRVDLAERQFGVVGRTMTLLPDSLEMKTTVGVSAVPDSNGQRDIYFFPQGGATGGTVELVRQSGAGVRIRVDWLFGQVTQEVSEL